LPTEKARIFLPSHCRIKPAGFGTLFPMRYFIRDLGDAIEHFDATFWARVSQQSAPSMKLMTTQYSPSSHWRTLTRPTL